MSQTQQSSPAIVEIRVHCVSGTAPESLLDTPHVVQVGGDGLGRIFRPADEFDKPIEPDGPDAQTRHILEGYHWGRMTSGGWSKAIWALLFPFALANVAFWMLPNGALAQPSGRRLLSICRGLMRLSAYGLSSLLMAQAAIGAYDLIANQCHSTKNTCLGTVSHLGWFWDHPMTRSLLVTVGLMLGVYLINRISTTTWHAAQSQDEPAPDELKHSSVAGPDFYTGDPDVPALRALHVTCSFTTATIVALGGAHRPASGWPVLVWVAAWVLWLTGAVAAALLADPTHPTADRIHQLTLQVAVKAVRPASALMLLAAGAFGPLSHRRLAVLDAQGHPKSLTGTGDFVGGIMVAMSWLTAIVALMLIVPAVQTRRAREHDERWATPRPFTPWAGGWFAAPVLALGSIFGAGLGLGLSYTASGCLQGSCVPKSGSLNHGYLKLPEFYDSLTEMWGIAAIVLVIVLLVLAIRGIARVIAAGVASESVYAPGYLLQGAATRVARMAVAANWQTARTRLNAGRVVTTLAVSMSAAGALALEALWLRTDGQTERPVPSWLGHLVDMPGLRQLARTLHLETPRVFKALGLIGVYGVDLLALGLLYAVYNAARRPNSARQLGIVWDLASYWPRAAHPYVPPCYAQKVVPELVARVKSYTDAGHRVVLCGHSQGTLLCASTLLRLLAVSPQSMARVGLVTAGSQLQWAYPRGFPSVIDVHAHRVLLTHLGDRWRNLVRGTDPLGGPVLTWDQMVDDASLQGLTLTPAASPDVGVAATDGGAETPTHARLLGAEHWLPDPIRPAAPYGAGLDVAGFHPGLHRHSDYWQDHEWRRAVLIAAGRTPPA